MSLNFGRSLLTLSTCLALTGPMPAVWANPLETIAVDASPVIEETPQAVSIPPACTAQLGNAINQITNNPTYRSGKWGIHIESAATGQVLYSQNADQYFIPASNIKLFTTAAALQLYDARSPIDNSNLSSWVQVINQRSHNGYADNLFRRIGGSPAVQAALSRLGVNGFRQADGSGLSRQNLVTPRSVVGTLKAMNFAYGKEVFFRSLPVAGQSGTLSSRFRSTRAQGIVHAKTGTLRGVRALSGYLQHPVYGQLVFSILINQPGQSGQTMLNGIDGIVLQMVALDRCYAS